MGIYWKASHCVYDCRYHIVWITKYRRQVLNAVIHRRLKELIADVSAELNIRLISIGMEADHVHLYVSIPVVHPIPLVVNRLKGYTSFKLKREFGDALLDHVDLSDVKRVGYDHAEKIAKNVLSRFNDDEFDVAKIYFSEFGSIINQVPTELQVIPAKFDSDVDVGEVYDYEPSEEGILAALLPRSVATQIFTALLENAASEQGARMSAMDNATRNAGEMIDKLTIQYNRSRQAKITNELIEIISGAEAL